MDSSSNDKWHRSLEKLDPGKHGKDYEYEVSKFIFKRLVDNNYKTFEFTREKKGLGKFDDLTYIYENQIGEKKYSLVQLKHLSNLNMKITYESLATSSSSYFLLSKYFNYFNKSLTSLAKDKDFVDSELESLIICTNIGLDDNLKEIKVEEIKSHSLFKNHGCLYKLHLPKHIKKQIFAENYQSDTERLAKELTDTIMMNKHIDINCLKKDDHVNILIKYHVALAENVINIQTKRFRDEFICDESFDNPNTNNFRTILLKTVQTFCDRYINYSVSELETALNIKSKSAYYLNKALSDYQSATSVEEFLFRQTISVKSCFGDALQHPEDDMSLPIEETDEDEIDSKIDNFLNLLIFATDQHDIENVTRIEMGPELFIAYNEKMNQWYHGVGCEKAEGGAVNRKWLIKENIISEAMKTTVTFQGKKVMLNELVESSQQLEPDIIMQTFCSLDIEIGLELTDRSDIMRYYIPRVLTRHTTLDKSILKSNENDVFLISNVNDSNIKRSLVRQLLREDMATDLEHYEDKSKVIFCPQHFNQNDFEEFVKTNCPTKNVHWIKHEYPSLIWQETFGSVSNLHKYFCSGNENTELCSEDSIHTNKRFIIIYGEPGMGKSTLVDKIAENIGKEEVNNTKRWIIKVSLKDCSCILDKLKDCKDLDNVIEFLSYFQNAEGSFSIQLLRQFLAYEGRTFILLDGFDELTSEDQQNKIIDLLNTLKSKTKVEKVVITTRPHYKEKLEDTLGVISFSIREINKEEQALVLAKYWTYYSGQDEQKMLSCAKELIKRFNIYINNTERSFLGIPLQTYMFAVVFLEEICKDTPVIPDSLPITSLMERFLHTKYDIYFHKQGQSISRNDKSQQFLRKLLDDVHQDFAVTYGGLLSKNEADFFDQRNNAFEDDEILDIGIVYQMKNKFYFLHKTFAEYLTAKRLVGIFLKKHVYKDECLNAFENVLLKTDNKFVLYLFDLLLTDKFKLLKYVLSGDESKVISFDKDEVNVQDSLRRNSLYYALQSRQFTIINMLIEKQITIDYKNRFFINAFDLFVSHYYETASSSQLAGSSRNERESDFSLAQITEAYINLTKYVLKDDETDNLKVLLDAYRLHIDTQLKNWIVVEVLLQRGCKLQKIKPLIDLLRNKAPLRIAQILVNRIRSDEMHKEKVLYDLYLDFGHIAEYLLDCTPEDIDILRKEYSEEVKDLIKKFNASLKGILTNLHMLGIRPNVSAFKKYIPLILLFDVYYDITRISPASLFSSVVFSLTQRAQSFTYLVETLLVAGAQCANLCMKSDDQILNDEYYDLLQSEFFPSMDLNMCVSSLEKELESPSQITSLEVFTDTWKVIQTYKEKIKFDNSTPLKKILCQIIAQLLNSSGAWDIMNTFHELNEAINQSNFDGVSQCLQRAFDRGYHKSILTAVNENFETVCEVATNRGLVSIIEIISKYKN